MSTHSLLWTNAGIYRTDGPCTGCRCVHVLDAGECRKGVMVMWGSVRFGFIRPRRLSRRILLLAAVAATQPVPPGLGGRNWTVIPAKPKVVALTFDAGANADGVASILATLKTYHVPATFFLTGNFVRDFPAESKAVAAAGQRIGDHSVSHPYFTKLTDAQARDQILAAQNQIRQVTGADPWPWFRFPYGDYSST